MNMPMPPGFPPLPPKPNPWLDPAIKVVEQYIKDNPIHIGVDPGGKDFSPNPNYPHMKLGGFKVGDPVRIGQSPYVFRVVAVADPQFVLLAVPGMTGRNFSVPFDCVELVDE